MVGAVPCLLRAVLIRRERTAWAVLGAAILIYAFASVYYYSVTAQGAVVPYPSISDAGWVALYPLAYVAVVLLLRARVSRFHASMWLYGVVAGLGAAALVTAASWSRPRSRSTGAGQAATW